ncbi:MAG: prolyl oligopeptidase family serine peptidase [Proteobacteria bacterium]|nr:prolyl oligopeptidase family serine peptidase [Pseudomonadota bacterium]
MLKRLSILSILALAASACATSADTVTSANSPLPMNQPLPPTLNAPPDNRPGNEADELWGKRVPDPYRWLEQADDPEVIAWVEAQDRRTRDFLAQLPYRNAFAARLEELLYVPSVSTPYIAGDYAFYFAREARDEKSTLYVAPRTNKDANARILIDPSSLSEDGSVSIGTFSPSPDGKLLAYTLKQNNADHSTLYIMDVETGQNLSDVIEGARYASPAWLKDGSGFYYTYFPTDETIPVDQRPGMTDVRFHRLGTSAADNPVIIPPLNDPTKFHGVGITRDNHWLVYTIQDGWNGNTLALMDRRGDDSPWRSLPTQPQTTYYSRIDADTLYLLTNENAPRYRIVKLSLLEENAPLDREAWTEIIPEFEDRVIENFAIIQNRIVLVTIKDVVHHLDVYDTNGTHLMSVPLPDRGTIGGLSGSGTDDALYFSFTSFKLPRNIYRLDMADLSLEAWKTLQTPANTEAIISEQIFATSKDGTRIPMFVLRHRDTPLDGSARTIVYGYGGFNIAVTPGFNPAIYAWLEDGGIYVFSNLRGGSEYGEDWHKDGMGLKKQNVFDDFYAVAETLIQKGYTSSPRMAAYGGSNGGLLVGAALTQRPNLFGAIVCAVPLLDMVRYHLFGSGRTWISEYSSVEADRESFEAILAYSPYANVVAGTAYPAVLFLGADSDDRVDPMHARKMAAAIQDATSGNLPVLLRIEKNAGHGGADLTHQRIAQFADMFAFLRAVLK